jgi:hypothetical protein
VWDLETLGEAPAQIQNRIDHARRFSLTIHGASVLYNLLLAEKVDRSDQIDRYRDMLDAWAIEISSTQVLDDWDRTDWWATILHQNPRVATGAQRFVNRWLDMITARTDVARNSAARDLVRDREIQIKGGRARLASQAALAASRGDSGMSRLTFRWGTVRSHLQDLAEGRAA